MIPPGERAPCEFAPNAAGGMNLSVSPRGAPDLGRSDSIFALLPLNVDAFFRDKGCRLPAPPPGCQEDGEDPLPGGVAALNHRLMALTPPG